MISIIDYEIGNVLSIKNALEKINLKSQITRNENDIKNSNTIILPGVGSFEKGMENLKKFDLIEILNNEVIKKKKRVLGICLGFQLMCLKSEEFGNYQGLGWLNLKVSKINSNNLRLPHVGWNKVKFKDNKTIFKNITKSQFLYFNHSYCIEKNTDKNCETLAECNYGEDFIVAIKKNNIFGIQPHPEKSQMVGLKILKNLIT